MTKKSILEEALLEVRTLEDAVKSNAKEILASTMRQEIEELVKESLTEQVEVEDYIEDTEEEEMDFDSNPDEPEQGFEDEDEDVDVDVDVDVDQEPLDLRGASDDEVLKVFKLMGSEDGIIVTQDDDVVDIKDEETGAEYKVELGESLEKSFQDTINEMDDFDIEDDETEYEIEFGDEFATEGEESDKKDLDQEMAMETSQGYDDTEDERLGMTRGKESGKKQSYKGRRGDSLGKWGSRNSNNEVEANEASRTYGFGSKKGRGLRKGFTDNRNLTFREGAKPTSKLTESTKRYKKLLEHSRTQDSLIEKLMSENKNVKAKSTEFKKALGEFRAKIQEVAVFNTNLAYATKLFTEHTTSKVEKLNIMRRFDEVENLTESKNLFRQLNSEFDSKTKSIAQSLKKKITKSPSKGSTNLIESKIYESPQISRIKDMMTKI